MPRDIINEFYFNVGEAMGYTPEEVDSKFSSNSGYVGVFQECLNCNFGIEWVDCIPQEMSYEEIGEFAFFFGNGLTMEQLVECVADVAQKAIQDKIEWVDCIPQEMSYEEIGEFAFFFGNGLTMEQLVECVADVAQKAIQDKSDYLFEVGHELYICAKEEYGDRPAFEELANDYYLTDYYEAEEEMER